MRIGVDIMGSDHGAVVPIRAAILAAKELPENVRLVLIGHEKTILDGLRAEGADPAAFDIVPSTDDISMSDHATKALAAKTNSSIALGFGMLKEGKLDAFASTGNTGAMLVGSVMVMRPLPGVQRPCITSILPKADGSFGLMVDVGANADCKPEVLFQFGLLGSLFAKHVYHIESPKVALLSIGEEEKKGNALTLAAHALMKGTDRFNFVGNVEGRDLFHDKADVVVCDGFTGNVVLKALEGFHNLISERGLKDPFLDRFDYQNYGGTPVLGVHGNVVIGHGISNAQTIKNMILFTRELVESKLNARIREAFQ
ncbi:MAG: phosphate acyltransferase PlsX [Flavobacteriales bacterium]|jgi:glycerol-3-phosphate acyltransferase PlsX|nr:phosphate acyltransferase PlsX [Flavobacteriales bacterium]MCI1751645.1 phosphate acyltransferase PlsX [Flavobacteriales bacterium]